MDKEEQRAEFLFRMYDKMWSNIDRHTAIVWQSIGAVVASLAVFSITDKVGEDVAYATVIVMTGWLIANLLDSNAWCARNMHIINNLERQFLTPEDAKEISHFFTGRRTYKLQPHLQTQMFLAGLILAGVTGAHFYKRIVIFVDPSGPRWLPYAALAVSLVYCIHLWFDYSYSHQKLVDKSPGKPITLPPTPGDTDPKPQQGPATVPEKKA